MMMSGEVLSKTVWSVLVENSVQQRFFSLDLADWIDSNISGGNKTVTNWQLTFSQATWALEESTYIRSAFHSSS